MMANRGSSPSRAAGGDGPRPFSQLSQRPSLLWLTLAAILAGGLAHPATVSASAWGTRRVAERPPGQRNVPSSMSFMQRSFIWPAGVNAVEFDYFVDSEPVQDQLRVYIDNALVWSIAGLNRAGRHRISIPAVGGPHTIRFAYHKNGSINLGLDTVSVDDVRFIASAAGGIVERHRFATEGSLAALGWMIGGTGGGWRATPPQRDQSAGRPAAQLGVDSTTSYMQKTATWAVMICPCPPWQGAVEFDYLVDSQAGSDFLRVYLDGALQWSASGSNRSGRQRIPVPGPGAHTIRFEYVKDGSGSAGRDTARVDRVTFIAGNGQVMELHDFAGRNPEKLPIRAGSGPVEWASGGQGGGWMVHRATPYVSYVPVQTPGAQLLGSPRYEAFAEPVVDGVVLPGEYRNATRAGLFSFNNPAGQGGRLALVASQASQSLFLGLQVQAATALPGGEQGSIVLYFDRLRNITLRDGAGCLEKGRPAPEDRRIRFDYEVAPGAATATITNLVEERGACAGGSAAWVPIAAPLWISDPSQIQGGEPMAALGTVFFELRVPLPPSTFLDGRVGFGLQHLRLAGVPWTERFPSDDNGGPVGDDTFSWETLSLTFSGSRDDLDASERLHAVSRFPLPERPRLVFMR